MKAILETIRVLAFGFFWLVALLVAGLIEVGLMMSDKSTACARRPDARRRSSPADRNFAFACGRRLNGG